MNDNTHVFEPRWRSRQRVSLIIWRSWVQSSHGAGVFRGRLQQITMWENIFFFFQEKYFFYKRKMSSQENLFFPPKKIVIYFFKYWRLRQETGWERGGLTRSKGTQAGTRTLCIRDACSLINSFSQAKHFFTSKKFFGSKTFFHKQNIFLQSIFFHEP